MKEVSKPLSILFTKSMKEGKIPDDWRRANVTPLFKKGSKFAPGNYRPVSLTSVVCKTMERIVKEALTKHLDANQVISDSQHGFRSGKSCQTNLLEFMEKMTEWADMGQAVDVIYLDFAKAFDKVCHIRLIHKLKAYGIRGMVVYWIGAWFRDGKQRLVIGGKESDWLEVLSSLVQYLH